MKNTFDFDQELKQIESLSRAKARTAHNQNLLAKRIKHAEQKIKQLRRFANSKPTSFVGINCAKRVAQMEQELAKARNK